MIPATSDITEPAQPTPETDRSRAVVTRIVREISPRGLEILESLNTVFDDLVKKSNRR